MCVGRSARDRLGCADVLSSGANLRHPAEKAELPGAYAYELLVQCGRWGIDPNALLDGTGLSLESLKE